MLRYAAISLLLLPSLALATPPVSAAAESGRVTFRGQVVQGEAGGVTGIAVPPSHRASSKLRVKLVVVSACDTHTAGHTASSRCTAGTAAPRITWTRGGPDLMVTTVYY